MHYGILPILGIVVLSGCAYIKPHSDSLAHDRYDTYAPKYTDAQKAAMSTDQKLAEYNKHVRPQDRLVCRRQKTVGTHFRQTVCRTSQETADERVAAQDYVREQRRVVMRMQVDASTRGVISGGGSLGPNPARGCP